MVDKKNLDFNVGAAAGGAVGGSMVVGLLGWWYVRAAPFLISVSRAFTKKKANKRRKSARMASSQAAMAEPKIPGRIGVQ
jgi:hypothetical protein